MSAKFYILLSVLNNQEIISKLSTIKTTIVPITLAILIGFIFYWLNFPVGWLLGPMIAGIIYAIAKGTPQPLPRVIIMLGKAIIGIATAFRFSPETISLVSTYAIPVVGCIFITAALSMLKGYLLSLWSGVSRSTGFLASIPGTASAIVAMSEELGADPIAVAILQYLRLLLVVFIMPTATIFMFPAIDQTQITTLLASGKTSIPMFGNLLIIAGCCGLGIWGGNLLRLASSAFLGSFIVGLTTLWVAPYQLQVPQWLFAVGLLLVGISIGVQFDWENARKLWKAILIDIALVIGLIIGFFGVGYAFYNLTEVDLITSLLSFTPGGLEAMIATVNELGGDAGLVLAIQLSRMLTIILVGPGLTTLILKRMKISSAATRKSKVKS
ncbi:MAG: AbrB family transcriptional regulator [Okeania sp. SIO2G4]|uniref:AbrB family transcriptional regulator n=1 Tax=Okeania sp. SIO2G5 TaxID=2607796 RepID=UPI0013BE22CD|nr:AbrB family transcriptional regulator [Okeania sp. SIO2G5]NEP75525.1 AbrB family transcriptional regulator [Okeania sp. SIO2G5]NEP96657.1 AbrB family transcriptional regulator [Okeania sp. SIO2F5]NEQ94372.1 AbrB family transcriptional regulator [Okeania sp. SIO2G4]